VGEGGASVAVGERATCVGVPGAPWHPTNAKVTSIQRAVFLIQCI
jgi:hypothetical protein